MDFVLSHLLYFLFILEQKQTETIQETFDKTLLKFKSSKQADQAKTLALATSQLEKFKRQIQQDTDDKINKYIGDFKKDLENSIENKILKTTEKINQHISNETKPIKSDITNINSKINTLNSVKTETEWRLLNLEGEEHKRKGQVGHFSCMIGRLGLAVKSSNKYRTEDSLKEILAKLKDDGIDKNEITFLPKLRENLQNIPTDLEDLKKAIEKILEDKL